MDELCTIQKAKDGAAQANIEEKICESNASETIVLVCVDEDRVREAAARLGNVRQLTEVQQLPLDLQPPPYLITTPFEGELFDAAHKAKYRILGPTAVVQLSEREEAPPTTSRPLYSLAMRGAVICFTGFRKKDELTYLITLIHFMGGSIRKDMSAKVTHLIANAAGGEKYRYACAFRLPVVSRGWVDACWDRRDDVTTFANDQQLINDHKLKVFVGARVCFVGFTEEETQHMAEVLRDNGGETCLGEDPNCTHIVMANGETYAHSSFSPCSPPNSLTSPPNRSSAKQSLYRRLSARLSRNSFRSKNESIISPNSSLYYNEEKENTPSRRDSIFSEILPNDVAPNLPSLSGATSNLQTSTTTLSSGKKRSRNSSETNLQTLDNVGVTPDKETDWKSPFKKLKIKDSFKFKSRPAIFKREKKVEKSPDICKTSSPNLEEEDSFCSLNASKQSGFFDISFASIKSGRTAKSASILRRSVKSFTASFRSERKKKYSKGEDESKISTPKGLMPNIELDISPVESAPPKDDVFKTPVSHKSFRRHSVAMMTPPPSHSRQISTAALITRMARTHTPSTHLASESLLFDGCQLLVVDDHAPGSGISSNDVRPIEMRPHQVRAEWFWASVQNDEAQDEKDYLYKDPTAESSRSVSGSPGASPRVMRKRKLRQVHALHKRRSSVGDAVLLSLSSNLLDTTPLQANDIIQETEESDNVVRKLMSPRQQVYMELVQTECNYVNILHTIVTLFKQPLEEMMESVSEDANKQQPLLNNTELKIIFGNLQPIYELHRRMLEELHSASCNWSEDFSIGRLVLKFAPDMVKAYPPFVNFFENTKEMLQQCDRDNPRFHAFLKICQSRPECGRQTLQELLIRPVQRLPSISLLLDDILKHTPKSNVDHAALVAALAGIKEVMTHINEDKRRTEGQMQMFDIYNDIDQCPAQLVSSHRSFVSRCEVVELSKELSGRGDHLTLFLFTDTMEVCKRRTKVFNNKSPPGGASVPLLPRGGGKLYRHLQLMPLSTVKRVVDIREAEDCHNVFALMCRSNQELKERLYSFMITDETPKDIFLRQLCRQMANTVCKADADKFLACLDSHQLDIDTSDLALGTLSKAFKFATRTRIKLESALGAAGWRAGGSTEEVPPIRFNQWVGRAFSFNKTPSKLKRAVSSMISPFGSTANLTPANQLAQMRLASCNNINELGSSNTNLVPPMSVQPQRKATAPR